MESVAVSRKRSQRGVSDVQTLICLVTIFEATFCDESTLDLDIIVSIY